MPYWLSFVIAALALLATTESGGQVKSGEGPVGRVAVTATGSVSFDGKPVTLHELNTRLVELKRGNGVVWYYREAAHGEPPKEAMEVMKLVADNRLPISMSTKPDYSDVVVPGGGTKPRFRSAGSD